MNIAVEIFEITADKVIYQVERSLTDQNIYKLKSPTGSYLIARDFYGIWVELTSAPDSHHIHLTDIGKQIEDHYNGVVPA